MQKKVGQQGLLQRSLVGSASGLLDGNQAKRAKMFKVSGSGSGVGPQSAKPGRFFFCRARLFYRQVPQVVLSDAGMERNEVED